MLLLNVLYYITSFLFDFCIIYNSGAFKNYILKRDIAFLLSDFS